MEKDEHDVEEEILEEEEQLDDETSALSLGVGHISKNFQINTTAWHKKICGFFQSSSISRLTQLQRLAFITPHIAAFDKESTQAHSALMHLFHTWTVDWTHLSFLVDFHNDTLPKILDCLSTTNVKPSVVLRVFDIIENIIQSSPQGRVVCTEEDMALDVLAISCTWSHHLFWHRLTLRQLNILIELLGEEPWWFEDSETKENFEMSLME
jgi:hypothetical protein